MLEQINKYPPVYGGQSRELEIFSRWTLEMAQFLNDAITDIVSEMERLETRIEALEP